MFSIRPNRDGVQPEPARRLGDGNPELAPSAISSRFATQFGRSTSDRDVRWLDETASIVRSRRATARGRPRPGRSFSVPLSCLREASIRPIQRRARPRRGKTTFSDAQARAAEILTDRRAHRAGLRRDRERTRGSRRASRPRRCGDGGARRGRRFGARSA
jgi:hypothetical protein